MNLERLWKSWNNELIFFAHSLKVMNSMTGILAILGPELQNCNFGARDRRQSLLRGGCAQERRFCVRAFGEVSWKWLSMYEPRWIYICVTRSGLLIEIMRYFMPFNTSYKICYVLQRRQVSKLVLKVLSESFCLSTSVSNDSFGENGRHRCVTVRHCDAVLKIP